MGSLAPVPEVCRWLKGGVTCGCLAGARGRATPTGGILGRQVSESLRWLGLREEDLKINRAPVKEWERLKHR